MENTNYKTITSKTKFEGRAYINGKYVDAIDGNKFETINPATRETSYSITKYNLKDGHFVALEQPDLLGNSIV